MLPPAVDRLGADAVLLRDLRHWPSIGLPQDRDHLLFGESGLLHGSLVSPRAPFSQASAGPTNGRQVNRGTQYLSMRYTERLADAGIEPSVGSRGDSYDNALAESVIGLFKTEVIRRRGPWRTLEAVEFGTLAWVDWFTMRRVLEPIGYVPPAEYEARYYEQAAVT